MATTTNGHYYPGQNERGSEEADILEQMKLMQESNDKIVAGKASKQNLNDVLMELGEAEWDIGELKTDAGHTIELRLNSSTYVLTATLKNKAGTVLSTANVDFPVEELMLDMNYDSTTKEIVVTLKNGQTRRISVADLISGLVSKTDFDELEERVETNETSIEALQTENTELKADNTNLRNALYKIPTETPAENVTLNKTSKNKFIKFGVGGNRKQDTYEGYNLLPIPNIAETTQNGITYSANNGEIKLNGTATGGNVAIVLTSNLGLTTTEKITIVRNSNIPTDTTPMIFITINGTELNAQNQTEHRDYRTLTAGTVSLVRVYIAEGTTFNNVTIKPMLYLGEYDENKTYEPYVGGQASPNPTYKQDIHAVGDNGVVNTTVGNKNWFDKDNVTFNRYSRLNTDTGELITADLEWAVSDFIKIAPTKNIVLQGILVPSSWNQVLCVYNANKEFVKSFSFTSAGTRYSYIFPCISEIDFCYIRLQARMTDYNANTVMLEIGLIATPYTPHQSQTYNMPCQKPMPDESDYFDWDREKEVHGWKKIVLDGTERIEKATSLNYPLGFIFRFYLNETAEFVAEEVINNLKATHFQTVRNSYSNFNEGIVSVATSGLFLIMIANSNITEVADFKAWLATQYANGTPVCIAYKLASPEQLPFTQAQKTVADQIAKAESYYEQTNIYSTDEVSPIYDVTAVGDTNLILDPVIAQVDLLS